VPELVAPRRGRRAWGAGLAVALLFVLSLPAVTTRIYSSDEVEYFSYLRSLWFDHDVSFENEYQHFYDAGIAQARGFHETFLERTTEAGRRINFATLGCAILWAPFYAVGDLVAHALSAAGRPVATDGYSWPYIAAVAYGSAAYGALSLVLAMRTARLLGGEGSALDRMSGPAAAAIWLGTPLVFYMYIAPPMSHATSACAVAAFLCAWLIVRERWSVRGFTILGILAAVMAMVREQDAFFVVAPALDLIVFALRTNDRREWFRLLRGTLGGTAAAVVAYLPQALAYQALNGHLGPSHLVARKMTWTAPHAMDVLASPSHGFLTWTPLALLALAGLAWLPRTAARTRAIGVVTMSLALAVVCQIYVGGSVESWTVAGAFGQRRFVALTPILVIGLAACLAGVRLQARRVMAVATAVLVWWNLGLVVQFGAGLMNRQRLEPTRVAYTSFVVLPTRLPELAWRYVFDRSSFYDRSEPHDSREGR
jgi:hypothetical protein